MHKHLTKTIIVAALAITSGIASAKPSMTEEQFGAYVHRAGAPALVLTQGTVTAVVKDAEHTVVRTDAAKPAAPPTASAAS